jgi:uncharacterized membrane protein
MTTITAGTWAYPRRLLDPLLAAAGLLLLLLGVAFGRHVTQPAVAMDPWMIAHLLTIIPAIPIGAVMLLRPKGDRLHRLTGRIWVGLMMIAALTSFGIRHLTGHLSPIHILSVITLVALPRAIIDARAGRIARHLRTMTIVYGALVTAGYFTLIPSRLLGSFLFG